MAKVLKVVAVVAAVVAVTIPFVGPVIGLTVATAATVAAVATAVSTVASLGANMLARQKRPDMRGTVSAVMIGMNMAVPYAMGRTYVGGMQVYDDSSGDKNYSRTQIMVVTGAGPIDSFEAFQADYETVTFDTDEEANGWYGGDGGHMWLQTRLGTRPDTAFTNSPTRPALREWTSAHKLSGYAAYRVTMKFDEEGKRYASGIPQFGVIAKMVKVYDPRKDSTYPGGSGAHRWNDESTWEWSENPGLHALTYAHGRFIEKNAAGVPLAQPVKIVGVGLAREAIDIPLFVELANLCDANGWKIGGAVYEGYSTSRWDNLKRILQAGGATPAWSAGMLTLRLSAPRPSLFTITRDDLAGGVTVNSAKPWRDRKNSIVARYRSEQNRWEYVQIPAVTGSTYLAEDGELKTEEMQFAPVTATCLSP